MNDTRINYSKHKSMELEMVCNQFLGILSDVLSLHGSFIHRFSVCVSVHISHRLVIIVATAYSSLIKYMHPLCHISFTLIATRLATITNKNYHVKCAKMRAGEKNSSLVEHNF